jgi:hypothetical protein
MIRATTDFARKDEFVNPCEVPQDTLVEIFRLGEVAGVGICVYGKVIGLSFTVHGNLPTWGLDANIKVRPLPEGTAITLTQE